ncbi:hypothetical protein KFE25_011991 [Diacronema lutheri]|uniref:T-complex protein 1 subunit alpha n=2 Tax=Diacronema lutheri TaxID=2081491 RepID=A0A8J6C582_DIALT|nr:hypothetical protein KFE25_011991 [Diacronema lutheri]
MQRGDGSLLIDGTRQSGQDVRTQNVTAVVSIANIVKTSLGPVGLDKMLVDEIGDVTITNDGATILKQLEVEHPAARVLVELSELQDQEVGDGTTSVVIIAAELLKRANDLVREGIHPTTIMSGYRLAMREGVKYIKETLAHKTASLGTDTILQCAKTTLNSKIFGKDSDFFAKMAVEAMHTVKVIGEDGKPKYPVKSVGIMTQHGGSAKDSRLLNGYVVMMGRAAQGMPSHVSGAKIALLDIDLRKSKMHMGVQVLVSDPSELAKIRAKELDITADRIKLLLAAGANVILTTKGIDDMALKYFVDAGAIACRRVKREDLRRIAKLTGGTLLTTFANMEGDESFDPACLGIAESVTEERVADDDFLVIQGAKQAKACSVLLRGANEHMLQELERSLHDALCVVKRVLESNSVVPGGGAVEASLSIYLDNFALTLGTREQLAVGAFADALLVIPKQLAINGAQDATDLVAKLRSKHHAAQTDASKTMLNRMGLDVYEGAVVDNVAAGVLEPTLSKLKILQFATEAAVTILRIDDMIKINPAQQGGR